MCFRILPSAATHTYTRSQRRQDSHRSGQSSCGTNAPGLLPDSNFNTRTACRHSNTRAAYSNIHTRTVYSNFYTRAAYSNTQA